MSAKLTDDQCNEIHDILINYYGYWNEEATNKMIDYIENLNKSPEKEIDTLINVFHHMHVNNGIDDSCKQCGLDLRHPVHTR